MDQIMAKRVGTGSKKILPGLVILSSQEAEVGGFKVACLGYTEPTAWAQGQSA